MNINNIHHIFLLGIGGIGMSALARYFKSAGKVVCGYDKTKTPLTVELENEGILIHYDDDVAHLPSFLSSNSVNESTLIIYTPAIPKDHKEFNHLKSKGYKLWKRSQVLGLITDGTVTIAVAGTHGKTTTSTMIAHILHNSGVNCTAFLGGISKNYNSNLILGDARAAGHVMVVEADEYDRSFLQLHPDFAMITSLDADHLDIYGTQETMIGSYREFAGQVKQGGTLVVKNEIAQVMHGLSYKTYGINVNADYKASNVRIENGSYIFDIITSSEVIKDLILNWPGRHNVENATGAFAVCGAFGLSVEAFRKGLASFTGVRRRFDYQIKSEQVTFIDDYAHHPEELRAAIMSVKELYPSSKILGIFQPHLYTRTRDFADGFAESLSLLDEVILLDIYPARELPIEGVSSNMILNKVTVAGKKISSRENLGTHVLQSDADVVLTLGAGDIDQLVEPLRILLSEKYLKQDA